MSDDERESAATERRHEDGTIETHPYADWDLVTATAAADDGGSGSDDDTAGTAGADGDSAASGDDVGASTDDLVWIGLPTPQSPTGPIFYEPTQNRLYEGELDEENETVRVTDTHREDVDEESLGEYLAELADDHGWAWLSAFAHEHFLEADRAQPGLRHQDTDFERRNVLADDPSDVAFVGSHTFRDASGRVHVIERRYDAVLEPESARATVTVESEYRIATGSESDRRGGDSELLETASEELEVSIDPAGGVENELASALKVWHTEHVGWSGDAPAEE